MIFNYIDIRKMLHLVKGLWFPGYGFKTVLNIKTLVIVLFFLVCFFESSGQKFTCGTKVTKDYIHDFMDYNSAKSSGAFSSLEIVNRKVSVALHLIARFPGCAGCPDVGNITSVLSSMDGLFAPIGLSFQVCSVDTVDGAFYFDDFTDKFDLVGNIRLHYNHRHMLNIYFVENSIMDSLGGFATLPSFSEGYVAINNNYIEYGVFAHELGHYFGLLHTFETTTGMELANESNCSVSGDLVCDTNADPDPSGSSVDENCKYIGFFTDVTGNYYTPPVSNIMSYYGSCTCKFSWLQYARMSYSFRFYYNEQLW